MHPPMGEMLSSPFVAGVEGVVGGELGRMEWDGNESSGVCVAGPL